MQLCSGVVVCAMKVNRLLVVIVIEGSIVVSIPPKNVGELA